jgi:HK97 family phage major capsid protein
MNIYEVSNKVDQLSSSWEEFKSLNNRRLQEIEQKGSADPLTEHQLNRLNQALDEYKSKIDKLETAFARPSFDSNTYSSNDPHKQAFNLYLRKGVTLNLENLECKSLSTVRDKEGRFLVTPHLSQQILSAINTFLQIP